MWYQTRNRPRFLSHVIHIRVKFFRHFVPKIKCVCKRKSRNIYDKNIVAIRMKNVAVN